MKKRILLLLLLGVVCFSMLHPGHAAAITPLDPNAKASLTLHYQNLGNAFPDLPIGIYRIADAHPDGTFTLIEPYAFYPINIRDITAQDQWHRIAQTLDSYITAQQLAPDHTLKTDENGTAAFADLKTGLYYVTQAVGENETGTYIFNRFLVYVPTPHAAGTFTYDVEARPKCTQFIPKTRYTVTKLWQDSGHQNNRPQSVTVDIYKDGQLHDTQILSGENNWSYAWHVSEADPATWTVAERTVPEGYQVTVRQNGAAFSIINTHGAQPPTPPETGDTFAPLPWILLMCFSGLMLLLLGLARRRLA